MMMHRFHSFLHDTLHRSTPSCMNGSGGMMGFVIKKNGDAVGRAHPDTNAGDVGHQGIHAFKVIGHAFPGNGLSYLQDLGAVHLMGHKDVTDA